MARRYSEDAEGTSHPAGLIEQGSRRGLPPGRVVRPPQAGSAPRAEERSRQDRRQTLLLGADAVVSAGRDVALQNPPAVQVTGGSVGGAAPFRRAGGGGLRGADQAGQSHQEGGRKPEELLGHDGSFPCGSSLWRAAASSARGPL